MYKPKWQLLVSDPSPSELLICYGVITKVEGLLCHLSPIFRDNQADFTLGNFDNICEG